MNNRHCRGNRRTHRSRALGAAAASTVQRLEPRLMLAAQLVADLNTGTPGSNPGTMVDLNGTLFFIADDGVHGKELWKSDGTSTGTVMVKDIKPGAGAGIGSWLINFGGRLFFAADDGVNGMELWRSDGTAEGTLLLKDIHAGGSSSPGANFTDDHRTRLVVGDTLYFRATDATGDELWKTDGTRRGTVQVKDIVSGAGSSSPGQLTELKGRVVFSAYDGVRASLFGTDGTPGGTVNLGANAGVSNPVYLAASGNYVYFRNFESATQSTLRRTDGTPQGTTAVGSPLTGSIHNITDYGGLPLFVVQQFSGGGYDLYRLNPTGTATQVKLAGPYNAEGYINVAGKLYFRAGGGGGFNGGLWTTDGTDVGTQLVADVSPDGAGRDNTFVRYGASSLLFFGARPGAPRTLWKSDGTMTGTTPIATLDLAPYDAFNPPGILPIGQTIYVPPTFRAAA
jgi:trimeric autotransporter adhesin